MVISLKGSYMEHYKVTCRFVLEIGAGTTKNTLELNLTLDNKC